MAEYDLKSAVLKIKTQPLNFGLYRGEDSDQVLITSKAPGAKQVAQIEAECGKVKRILKGICFWEETTLVFASKSSPAPAWELMINKIFKDHKCGGFLPINLRQLPPNASDEVNVEEPGDSASSVGGQGAPGAPGQPPPPTPPLTSPPAAPKAASAAPPPTPGASPNGTASDIKARWDRLKAKLIPSVKVAMTDPAKKEPITKIVAAALAKEKAGAFAEAMAIFEKLEPIVTAGAAPAKPPVSPPPPSPKPPVRPPNPGKLQAAMNKLTPAIKQAITANPGMKEQILRPVVIFQGQLKNGDLEPARKTLGDLAARIQSVLAASPSAGRPGPAAFGGRTLSRWQSAKETVGEQISKLQGVMRQSKDPLLIRIADQGLNATTGRLQVGLHVALMEFDSASGEAKQKAAAKARGIIAEFRSFLQSDPVLPLLENNPLGVPVNIRSTLGVVLDSLDAAITA